MASVGSIVTEKPAVPTRLRRRCALPVRAHTLPVRGILLTDQFLALIVLASCLLLSSLAPRTSAVGYAALSATPPASRLTAQRTEPPFDARSDAEDVSGSRNDDASFTAAPVHVFRDPVTGKLVEEAESERREDDQQVDSAAALAAELDSLYMEDSAPVRGRGNRAAKLGRKSSLGSLSGGGSSSSSVGGAGDIAKEKSSAPSSSDPTAATVSASSLGGSRATRGSRRGARRLSFGH